jgi:alpha-glucosidase
VVARQKGDEWWVAALTDWERRTVDVPLGFLGGGTWEATLWTDGTNADKVGTDYRRTQREVSATEPLHLEMAPGGGAVVRLRRR